MRVFLRIFYFFNYYFKEGHCIPAFISGVLLSRESRTSFDCWVSLVGFWPRLFTQGYGCTPCLRIESLCSARLICWGFCRDKPANLKSVMAFWLVQHPLLFPSSLTSAWLPVPAAWAHPPQESGSSTVIHAAPGQGSDCSEKMDCFSDPASCQHGACPHQPVELAVTVDGYPWAR